MILRRVKGGEAMVANASCGDPRRLRGLLEDSLPPDEQARYSGLKDWRLWWLLFVGTVLTIYGFFLWFRFQYPVKMLPW